MKIFFSVLCLSALLFTACKKNNDVQPASADAANENSKLAVDATYASYKVIAGASGQSGFQNGNGNKARFNSPRGIWVNKDGSLLVADHSNDAIRKLTSDTVVTTLNVPKTSNNESLSGPDGIAALNDGTVGMTDGNGIWFYKPNNNTLSHYITNFHESITDIDANPDGSYFWFTNNYKLGYTQGNNVWEAKYSVNDTDYDPLYSVSACANGRKYTIGYENIYALNADGSHSTLFPYLTFKGLGDIVVSKDGSKIYFIENGDIKMIENCYRCQIKKTTLAIRTKASYLALANSGRFLYFTSSYYNTVNKLTL
ncbi:hypothetical protein IM792_02795 [Mucilaginibacter sp. JRF]|uniref:hypothetical protein n=1 Tax=Mucilaginibacter sp. JRF TaxID=2780088 RepID=UPI00187E5E72|nr:hypothetical protein [Mucilaginibacter sp. JRF]MBE9583365.1 hypothetical protein [Mucilaginibacter sp. JRF]